MDYLNLLFLLQRKEEKDTSLSYLKGFLLRSNGIFLWTLKGRNQHYHQVREHEHISIDDTAKNLSLDLMWFKKKPQIWIYRNDQLKKISHMIHCQIFIYSFLWTNVQTTGTRRYKQLWNKLIHMLKCSNLWLLLLLFLNNCKSREILGLIWVTKQVEEQQRWVTEPRSVITLL